MIEKVVYLEGIDPQIFYGSNNRNFEILKSFFPRLRIIGRNDEVKIIGESLEINRFEDNLKRITSYLLTTKDFSEDDIEKILTSDLNAPELQDQNGGELIIYGNSGRAIKARSENQNKLVTKYPENDLIFAIGPAGTGKTYTAIALAVRALREKEVKRIILTRPAVEAGEKLGFLPGDMRQKLDPYLQPLYDALKDMIPQKKLENFIEEGIIEIAPLAYMRGRTLGDAFVILDEGQNTTMKQLKMFLTRMGKNAKFIVTGDITQIDLPEHVHSGLIIALNLLKGVQGIGIIEFDTSDIVRHRLVKQIVDAFQKTPLYNPGRSDGT